MDLKRNWGYHGIYIFVVLMQLYFIKCNSGLDKMMPILSRLKESEIGEEYILVYLAFLTPLIILILYFSEWKIFYIDAYGILQISRSMNIYGYIVRLLLLMGKQVFLFVSLSVFTNYIFDFEYANNHPIEMLASFFDYYLAVFSMCVLVFLVSLYVRRVVASVICIILSIVSICVCNTTSGIFRVLPVNHIVKNVKYTGTKEYVLYIIPAILLCLIFYFVCVWKLKNKDFCGGRWDG